MVNGEVEGNNGMQRIGGIIWINSSVPTWAMSPTGRVRFLAYRPDKPAIVCIRRYETKRIPLKIRDVLTFHVHLKSQKKRETNTPRKRSGSSTCRTFLSLRQRGPSSSRRTRPPEPAPTLGKRRAQDLDGAASSVSPATRFNHPRVRCGDFTKIYSPSSACAPLRRAAPAAVSTPAPCRRCVSVNPDCFFSISYSCFVFISLRICHKRSTWIINCTFDQ